MIQRVAILGATGDLASRYLLPALAELRAARSLPDELRVVAVDRDPLDSDAFRRLAVDALARHAEQISHDARDDLVSTLDYHRADVTDPGELGPAVRPAEGPIVAYLALPPTIFKPAVEALAAIGVAEGSRLVVEKPFGEDLASAEALNRELRGAFPETVVHRVDHFLGKQTVQNVLGLRFANRIFEPLWNREHIERVEITWDETLSVAGRAGYYDRAGALRDMLQNHLLQILCLVAMEVPLSLAERDLRDRKVEILRAVSRLDPGEVGRLTARGRYGAGRIGEQDIPAYVEEPSVDPARETETFAAVTLTIDSWRWAGVPFLLRSGKALAVDRREIAVRFRQVPHLAFGQTEEPHPNVLRLKLDPDGVALAVNINGPGDPFTLEEVELGLELAAQDLSAYGRVILDVLAGDPTLSIRADEAEESWRIIEPIVAAWRAGAPPLLEYPAGSSNTPECL